MKNAMRGLSARVWCVLAFLGSLLIAVNPIAVSAEECLLEPEWQSIFDSGYGNLTNDDWAFDVTEDSLGNIVVCGVQPGPQIVHMWRVEKFSPDGQSLWVDTWSPREDTGDSFALSIAATPEDEVVVTGWAEPPGDLVVRKYDPAGNIQWTYTFSGEPDTRARGMGLAVNDSGELYVVGHANLLLDVVLLKLTPNGSLAWVKYPGIKGAPWGFALAANGDILVALEDYVGLKPTIMRLDSSGNVRWTWKYEPAEYGVFENIAVDVIRGCFYVEGTIKIGTSYPVLVKFPDDPGSSQGLPEWIGHDIGFAPGDIDVDSAGNLWATGKSDLWTIAKFDTITDPGKPPPIACIMKSYDWVEQRGNRQGNSIQDQSSYGWGIKCTKDGGLASCGWIFSSETYGMASETVKLMPAKPWHGGGPGPIGNGNPDTPGHGGTDALKPGDIKVAGGSQGYVDPRRGGGATVSVFPTSAGEVVLKVVDRRGSVLKEMSAPASGSGAITLVWDGTDAAGNAVAPGIYAVLVKAPGIKKVQKVAVVY